MNISGNASNWITEEEKTKKETTNKTVKKKNLNVTKEFRSLKKVYDEFDIKHKQQPNKDLHDALISIYAAIKALDNINN